ncbi:MAG: CoA transferase [Deltaproteobacteria bacterium]|nr:MAG: CoA transferase [Deltaproteobacteria bacterium]
MEAALEGIRILDLSRLLPGPFCSMLLADFGADVVKIEAPITGDYIRWWPPRFGGNSGFHVVLNRNKRSLTLNLKTAEGKEIFQQLVGGADVVLEGFRPGVMERLGQGYERLARVNPDLIYCAITGYGRTGPRALRSGHDINYLALGGVLSHSGRDDRPTLPGVQIADLGGGALLAAFSVVTALLARERAGGGQCIDISMLDGTLSWNCLRWGKYLANGAVPRPGDDIFNHGFACYNLYETRDRRYMALGALEPQFWEVFCEAMERPDWNRKDYFEPGSHQRILQEEIAAIFQQKTQADWIEHFENYDCCCEPLLHLNEAMEDSQVQARNMVVELVHESWGAYRQLGIAPKFSRTPGKISTHAPDLGEHTGIILEELGYSRGQIETLRANGVV